MAINLTLEQVAASLGIEVSSLPDSWNLHWDTASSTFPGVSDIPFLHSAYIQSAGAYARLTPDKIAFIQETAALIARDAKLAQLAWLWHRITFGQENAKAEPVGAWPMPSLHGPQFASRFPAVILLSGIPQLKALHAKRNIPEDVVAATMRDLDNTFTLFVKRHGFPGLGMRYFGWLMNHLRGELYRLGRLQFGIRTFGNFLSVYRNRGDNRIIALSAPNLVYREDGLIQGTNDRFDDPSWTSAFTESNQILIGHSVSSEGFAEPTTTTLNRSEWQRILAPGDPVYDVHIPAAGRLSPELYNDAYERAPRFFGTCYPELTFHAFICSSWLLDPQLKSMLDPEANIIQFQSDYHLYPIGGNDASFYHFLFDCNECPVDQLPEQSSMQKKVKAYMLAGGQMRAMGGFKLLS